jgi:mono/diheme cytochrome c family protein
MSSAKTMEFPMHLRKILLGATALLALPAVALGAELTGYLTSKNVESGTFVIDNIHRISAGSGVDLGALELGRRFNVTYDGPETAMVASAVTVVPPSIAAPPPQAPVAAAEPAAPAAPAPAAPAAPAEVAQAPAQAPAPAAPAPAAPAEPAAPAAPAAPAEVAQAAPGGAGNTTSFTAEQAARGGRAYEENCAGCHGSTLGGGGEAPGLLGNAFRDRLIPNGDAAELYAVISTTMPQQAPGTLPPETYADITAFLMEKHQLTPGTTEFAPPQ